MTTRVVTVLLSVSLGVRTPAAAQTPTCDPMTRDCCAPKTTCTGFVDDRIELELAMQLDPDVATGPATTAVNPGVASLLHLRDTHHARLETSVAVPRAKSLHVLQYYTLRFKPGVHMTPHDLRAVSAEFLSLGPTVVKRAAPVPSARPTTDDAFVGHERIARYPDTASCGTQWYLFATGVDAAWRCNATGQNVVVADVDWGFDLTHAELTGAWNASHVYDMCNGKTAPGYEFHGTGVAGLIVAQKDNGGMRGIAYDAKLWPLTAACAPDGKRPCDVVWDQGNPWADAISTVMAATCDGCKKVVLLEAQTCCLGNYESSVAVNGLIRSAIASNIPVVVAAGNGCKEAGVDDDGNAIFETDSIVVGATDYGDAHLLLDGSNYGSRIDVSAPGSEDRDLTITTAAHYPCQVKGAGPFYTETFGGTSGAAAKVAGVVALMLQKNPSLTPANVKQMLQTGGSTVSNIDGTKSGGVFLDAGKAVAAATAPDVCPP